MKKYLILFALLLSAWTVNAQVTVRGVVRSSDDGEPMIGVSVFEQGTTNGVITDSGGNYSIRVQNENSVLVFSFIGFKEEQIAVRRQSVINVVMDVDNELLEDVIVLGYSNKSKNEIASAVAVVSSEKLLDVTSPTIGDMLQGKVAGVSVVKSSGAPGAEPTVRIRGISSMSAPQSPLYVVDGIIGGDFDPNDVESLTILKDAGATGLYGAQANGGVIVVTTKRAKSSTPTFNFKASVGVNVPDFSRQKYMDSKELRSYYREYYRNPNTYLIDEMQFRAYFPESIEETNTDWRAMVFKPALEQNYYFSLTGRTDRHNYYTAITYYDENGTQLSSNYKHLNVRSNNSFKLTDWLTLTSNLNVKGSMSKEPESAAGFLVVEHVPFDSPYDEDGNLVSFVGKQVYTRYPYNPMFLYDPRYVQAGSKGFNVNWDITLDVKITPWLSFTTQNRLAASTWKWHRHKTADAESPWESDDSIEENQSLGWGGITTNLFKAAKDWGQHSFSGLAGYEAQMDWSESLSASATGLPYGLFVLDVATANKNIGGSNSRSGMQSLISQFNYNYAERYFFTAAFRVDQSSTFAKNNRTAFFPSASASWLVSNEQWFKSAMPAVSNLKLKVSWGKTGMKDIGASKYLASYSYSGSYFGRVAAVPAQMANPSLKWEQTTQTNLGLELGLWKNRVNFDINLYRNYTQDLLVNRDLAPSGGFTKQWQNFGALINTGAELTLNVIPVKTADFTWDVDFSIAYNKNTVTGFGDTVIYNSDSYDRAQVYKDGYSLNTWYLKDYAGIDPQTGRESYYDENGNITTDFAAARYSMELGSAIAPWQGGFSTSLQYKNFRLSTTGSFLWGNMIYSAGSRASNLQVLTMASLLPSNEDSIWRKPGDVATIGLPAYATANIVHSGFLKKGDYLKIRNITLSYTLPKSIMKKNELTFSIACNNVLTLAALWGGDPETGSRGIIESDDLRYPNQRGFVFQTNFTF